MYIGVCFRNCSHKVVCLFPESFSERIATQLKRILIKEIISLLKCKYALDSFNFIKLEHGWTESNGMLDPSLFCTDNLHLIQEGISSYQSQLQQL